MSNAAPVILAGFSLAAVVAPLVLWRSGRETDAASYLKNTTVSPQRLMEHQSEDRS